MLVRNLGPLTRNEVLERAHRAMGRGTRYVLGAGGRDPRLAHPGPDCDCSGFAAWAMGVDRYLPNAMVPYLGGAEWFETSALWRDGRSPYGFVAEKPWRSAQPGDLLVWPDRRGRQGHVGIVSTLDLAGPATAIHCSAGNWRSKERDAILETDTGIFSRNGAAVLQVLWVKD